MRDPFIYYTCTELSKESLDHIRESYDDIDPAQLVSVIRRVTLDIDVLTFNRIEDFFALTPFQQKIIVEVCTGMIVFRLENADLFDSPMKSYSINGVSMSFDNAAVKCISGVYIPGDVYALLQQTGLCCRVL